MKRLSCVYIVAGIFTVLSISLYFAYKKKQEDGGAKRREAFRGGGEALRYGSAETQGAPMEAFCASDADCGVHGKCGVTGFCVYRLE